MPDRQLNKEKVKQKRIDSYILGSHVTSEIIHRETNENVEKICKVVYFLMVQMTLQGTMFPLLCITLVNYFILDLKERSFFLPIPVRWVLINKNYHFGCVFVKWIAKWRQCFSLPFNWKTPLGYSIAWTLEYMAAFSLLFFCVCVMCIYLGLTWTISSILKDIANDLCLLEMDKKCDKNIIKLKRQFRDIVQSYAEVKELS